MALSPTTPTAAASCEVLEQKPDLVAILEGPKEDTPEKIRTKFTEKEPMDQILEAQVVTPDMVLLFHRNCKEVYCLMNSKGESAGETYCFKGEITQSGGMVFGGAGNAELLFQWK